MNDELIDRVKTHCKKHMEEGRCKTLPFHNWEHTLDVVSNSHYMALREKLEDSVVEELIIASFFHDTGNKEAASDHEQRSCENARQFLRIQNYSDQGIVNITELIMATQMPQRPESIAQQVICDADLAHLGKINFFEKNQNLRSEWRQFHDMTFTDDHWIALNIKFLKEHRFHTTVAQTLLEPQKDKNLHFLEKLLTTAHTS